MQWPAKSDKPRMHNFAQLQNFLKEDLGTYNTNLIQHMQDLHMETFIYPSSFTT